jgi:hypothetical protein
MLDTLLDVSGGSIVAFGRESVALALAGLRSRARITAAVGTRRLFADACCAASTLWALVWLAVVLPWLVGAHPHQFAGEALILPLAFPAALALIGFDRAAGITGLAWIAVFEVIVLSHAPDGWRVVNLPIGLVALPYVVMVAAPRARRRDPRRLLVLAVVVLLGLVAPLTPGSLPLFVLLAASLAGLVRLPTDPRLAIASAIVWSGVGVSALMEARYVGPVVWTTATAPLVLGAAILRLRSVRRRAFG